MAYTRTHKQLTTDTISSIAVLTAVRSSERESENVITKAEVAKILGVVVQTGVTAERQNSLQRMQSLPPFKLRRPWLGLP